MLSVYRDHGIVPKESRDDNFNKTPLDLSRYQEVRAGDLVINKMKAWQGSLGISDYHGIVSPDYLVCALSSAVHGRYLHHLLRSSMMIAEYGKRSKGIRPSQWRLYWEDLAEISIDLPPVEEQRRIADFLDAETARIDQLVALRREQLDLFAERYVAFLSEAVTPGIGDPSAVRSPSYPWLPGTLRTARLGHFIKIQSGITVDGSRDIAADSVRRPYLRVANVQDGQIDLAEVKEIEVSPSMARRATLIKGDVVITEANGNPDNLGRGAVWRGEIKGMVHQNHIFALRADRRRLMPEFLALTLASLHGRAYFRATSSQVGIATTSSSKIAAMPFPLMALPRQKQIIATCEQMRTAAEGVTQTLRRQVELLEERRRAVVTAAVTGELDVTTARRVS
ncbi:restriction endonuclease subunit S [Actinomadura bangladeshensis]|uniref:Uncharacterized protein n=1 Tax=Actinomadura bangladeshensis TaxID=453573 RepID=A0A4R4PCZ5_9ACTN|nr:restriction endonuclease subunit S [Actinomadura bangladeshensis]TDC20049.1 hypothetical protein E1284_01475 [Actinomadura bangladeshensis]